MTADGPTPHPGQEDGQDPVPLDTVPLDTVPLNTVPLDTVPLNTVLLDLLGRRWMPRIIAAFDAGAIGFNELRRRCDDMSASVLSRRLGELRDAGLAVPDEFGSWEPTDAGRALARHLVEAASGELNR